MKNILYVAIVLMAFTSCQKEQKIGYIDNGKVINDYQGKKDLEAKFQAKDAAFQKSRITSYNVCYTKLLRT